MPKKLSIPRIIAIDNALKRLNNICITETSAGVAVAGIQHSNNNLIQLLVYYNNMLKDVGGYVGMVRDRV